MADFEVIPYKDCEIGCYSERGLISYFVFCYLPIKDNFARFINQIFNKEFNIVKYTLFSELDFSNRGFGKPDGAFCFTTDKDEKCFVFFEGKFNERFEQSAEKALKKHKEDGNEIHKEYGSSIIGQLELKMRLVDAIENVDKDNQKLVVLNENQKVKAHFMERDSFYEKKSQENTSRHLRLENGVEKICRKFLFDYGWENVYYLSITEDTANPYDALPEKYQLTMPNKNWVQIREKLLWTSVDKILELIK